MNDITDFFGEPISVYTRADAIADGHLVDVSETAREVGFKFPVAVTRPVWEQFVAWDNDAEKTYQDESGRLWDVLYMAHFTIKIMGNNNPATPRLAYELLSIPRGKTKAINCKLHIHIGPGDAGEPVLTIMLPEED